MHIVTKILVVLGALLSVLLAALTIAFSANADAIRKKAWVPTLKKAGVRYRNPYQTRHTFATKHISQGVNLFWLAGQMGHKGPEMIFRNYGKYLAEYDGKTAKEAVR